MQATNSYVFIPKEEKFEENVIRLRDGIPHIFEKHFNIDEEKRIENEIKNNPKQFSKDIKDIHTSIIRGSFNYKKSIIEYRFIYVDGVYYLDVIMSDNKKNIIECLTDLNDVFLTNTEFNERYIPIISYDYVSENYCNKLYPLLNKFERKFRKLLFLIFTANFKELYFEATASDEMIIKAKENIKNSKNIYRIQNYFYSIDIGTLRSFLFDKRWTIIEEEKKNEILKQDLSKMSEEELKLEISKIEPTSNWNRFFKNKGFSDDINATMKSINELRNLVAHNKIISVSDYNLLKKQLNDLTIEINKAIKITESVDFIKINNKRYAKIFAGIRKTISAALEEIHYNDYFSKAAEGLKNDAVEFSLIQSSMVKAFLKGLNASDTNEK